MKTEQGFKRVFYCDKCRKTHSGIVKSKYVYHNCKVTGTNLKMYENLTAL
jgi:hypothetical protein